MEDGAAMLWLKNHDDGEEQQKINELYDLLQEEGRKDYLKAMEKRTTCHTPLHEAATTGMSHLALEVANLKPSLAWKLNHEGLSPMHLALLHGHVQTVRALMAFNSDLIRVKGRNLVTPLHYAAKLGETELLAEFLCACPSSIEDLTSRCETAMHVAVRNKRLDTCKVLLGWIIRKCLVEILSWKDEDGNNVLHIATHTNQPEVVKLLIKRVKVNAKNFAGLTALDLCYAEGDQLGPNVEVRKILCDAKARRASEVSDSLTGAGYFLQTRLFLMEWWDHMLGVKDTESRAKYKAEFRETTRVVAVLIATATYQGVLSPPGGYWQDDSTTTAGSSYALSPAVAAAAGGEHPHTAGKMIMRGQDRMFFIVFNSMGFATSVIAMVLTLFSWESALTLFTPVAFALITYMLAVKHFLSQNAANALVAHILAMGVMIVVAFCASLCSWLRFNRRKAQLDVPGRHFGGYIF